MDNIQNLGNKNKIIYIILIIIIVVLILSIGSIFLINYYRTFKNENINKVKLNKVEEFCNLPPNKNSTLCAEANKNVYALIPPEYLNNLGQNLYTLNDKAADELILKIKEFTQKVSDPDYFRTTSMDEFIKEKIELTGKPYLFLNADKELEFNKVRDEFNLTYGRNLGRSRALNEVQHTEKASLIFGNNDYLSLTTPFLKNLFSCIGQKDTRDENQGEFAYSGGHIFKGNLWCNKDGNQFIKNNLGNYFDYYRFLVDNQLLLISSGLHQDNFIYLCNDDTSDNRALYYKNLDYASQRSSTQIIKGIIDNDIKDCGEEKPQMFYYFCKAIINNANSDSENINIDEFANLVNTTMDLNLLVEQTMAGLDLGQLNNFTQKDQLVIKENLLSNPDLAKEKYLLLVKNKIITYKAIYKHNAELCNLIINDELTKNTCFNALKDIKSEDNWCYQELLKFSNKFNEIYNKIQPIMTY